MKNVRISVAIAMALSAALALSCDIAPASDLRLSIVVPELPAGVSAKGMVPGASSVRVLVTWQTGEIDTLVALAPGQNQVTVQGVPLSSPLEIAITAYDGANQVFATGAWSGIGGAAPIALRLAPELNAGTTPFGTPVAQACTPSRAYAAMLTSLPSSGYYQIVASPEMAGLVWLDVLLPDGARAPVLSADRAKGWVLLDLSAIPDTAGSRDVVVSFVSFARVGAAPNVTVRTRRAFFVTPSGSGDSGTPDAPGAWADTVTAHRTDTPPCSVFFREGTYPTDGTSSTSFVDGNVSMYGGFSTGSWAVRTPRSSTFSSVSASASNTLYFGDMSSNATVTIDGFTVTNKTSAAIDSTAISTLTTGTIVISNCLIEPENQAVATRSLTGIELGDAGASSRQYVLGTEIRAGSASSASIGVSTTAIRVNFSNATSNCFIYGSTMDGGAASCTAPGTASASTYGVFVMGSGLSFVIGSTIWGGVSSRTTIDNAASVGVMIGGSAGVILGNNLVCGGWSVAGAGATPSADGIRVQASANTGLAHFNAVFSGSTSAPDAAGPYGARYSVGTFASHSFSGNIVVAHDDGVSSCAVRDEDPDADFNPFVRNALFGRVDVEGVVGGTGNLFRLDWNPATALEAYANEQFITFEEFLAANLRVRSSYRPLLGVLSFADASLTNFKNPIEIAGFQFGYFDVEGNERPQYGDWQIGPWR